jgi:hypothetical protein
MTINTCSKSLAIRNPGPGSQPSGGLQTIPPSAVNLAAATVPPGWCLVVPITSLPLVIPDWVGLTAEYLYYATGQPSTTIT